jgi:hypothetical protein
MRISHWSVTVRIAASTEDSACETVARTTFTTPKTMTRDMSGKTIAELTAPHGWTR